MRWTPRDSFALVAGLGIVLIAWALSGRAFPAEWRKHQRDHAALRRAAGLPPVKFGIRTIRPASGNDERCPTCHLGTLHEPLPVAPFQAHPDTGCRLPPAVQGCTACHRGEGWGLTAAEAHGRTQVSRTSLLDDGERAARRSRLQAGCAGCHVRRDRGVLRYDAAVVPEVAAGLLTYLSRGCASCHRLPGVFSAAVAGPGLDGIGMRMSRAALTRMIVEPQRRRPGSVMPPSTAAGQELERLLTFLQAQVGVQREAACGPACVESSSVSAPTLASHFDDEIPERPNPAAGALWARRAGCPGCHGLSEGERGVPDLSRLGWFRNELHFRQVIAEPAKWAPGTVMPALRLPEVVAESVVAWLSMQRRTIPSRPQEVLGDACFRCHGKEPEARVVVLSRRPPRLEGRKANVPRDRFVQVATEGVEHTAMAPWGRILTPAFLGAMHDALE